MYRLDHSIQIGATLAVMMSKSTSSKALAVGSLFMISIIVKFPFFASKKNGILHWCSYELNHEPFRTLAVIVAGVHIYRVDCIGCIVIHTIIKTDYAAYSGSVYKLLKNA